MAKSRLNILFIIGDMGGFNFVSPIYAKLSQRGHHITVVLGQSLAGIFKNRKSARMDFQVLDARLFDSLFAFSKDSIPYDVAFISGSRTSNLERRAIEAARRRGIYVYEAADTWSGFRKRYSDIEDGQLCNDLRYLPDRVLVVDNRAREKAIEEGIPEGKIVITGNPHFEKIHKKSNRRLRNEEHWMRRLFSVSPDYEVVLFASQPFFFVVT